MQKKAVKDHKEILLPMHKEEVHHSTEDGVSHAARGVCFTGQNTQYFR